MSFDPPPVALPPNARLKASPALQACFRDIPPDGKVLDVGCFGFQQRINARLLGHEGFQHFGVDTPPPDASVPPGFVYRQGDLDAQGIPFPDDLFDLVVASHVVEHLRDPVRFYAECVRVCRPGGLVYIEAPSDRAALLPSIPFALSRHLMTSYYDDPTHISRPWTPLAFFKLARYYGIEPLETQYIVSWRRRLFLPLYLGYAALTGRDWLAIESLWQAVGWACYMVLRKPVELRGSPELRYYMPT